MRDADERTGITQAELDQAGFYYVDADMNAPDQFSGVAFSDTAVVVGSQGFADYCASGGSPLDLTEGRFSACVRLGTGDRIAFADPFGLDPLFYYWSNRWWAVSNSLKLLIDRVSATGRRLTLHRAGLASFLLDHSFGQTLVSGQTAVAEIKVVPAGLALMLGAKSLSLVPLAEIQPELREQDYSGLIGAFVSRWRDRIRALHKAFPHITVDLSGGVDSRLTFGLAHTAGLPAGVLEVHSNSAKPDDYRVATTICKAFGYTPTPLRPLPTTVSNESRLDLTDIGNLGTYSPVYLPTSKRPQQRLHIHGGAGEFYRRYYSAPSLDGLLGRLWSQIGDRDIYNEIKSDVHKDCASWGVDPNSPDSLLEHYRHNRGRFHFGRNAFRSLSGSVLTPLATRELLRARHLLTPTQLISGDMIRDLFIAIAPELLDFPFDKPEKSAIRDGLTQSPLLDAPPHFADPVDLNVFGSFATDDVAPSIVNAAPFDEVYTRSFYRALAIVKGSSSPFDIAGHQSVAACIGSFDEPNLFPNLAARCHLIRLAAYLKERGVSEI